MNCNRRIFLSASRWLLVVPDSRFVFFLILFFLKKSKTWSWLDTHFVWVWRFYFFLVYMTPEATSNLGSSSSGVSFRGGAARGALLRGQASLEGRLWRGWRIDGVDNPPPPLMIGRLTSRDPGPFHLSVAGKKIHPAGGVDWWISTPSSVFPLPFTTCIVLPVNCELFPL